MEGQNLIIERRYSEGQTERWPEGAAELLGFRVDAMVVNTTVPTKRTPGEFFMRPGRTASSAARLRTPTA
jgi:hypothetical protein